MLFLRTEIDRFSATVRSGSSAWREASGKEMATCFKKMRQNLMTDRGMGFWRLWNGILVKRCFEEFEGDLVKGRMGMIRWV